MENEKCNGIEYVVEEDVVGIVDGEKYEIEDNKKTYNEWRKLQNDFAKNFSEFSLNNPVEYELPEWHHGTKSLWVYLYNENFYNRDFIPKILNILNANGVCFAQFECYNDSQELIGDFQVYKDKVCFDELFESSGFIQRLCK